MHRSQKFTRRHLCLWTAGCLVAGGFLSGCGSEEGNTSKTEPPGSQGGAASPSTSKVTPAQPLPKNVNPNASNKGIKGKYAD
jgi:hypothetical protein